MMLSSKRAEMREKGFGLIANLLLSNEPTTTKENLPGLEREDCSGNALQSPKEPGVLLES